MKLRSLSLMVATLALFATAACKKDKSKEQRAARQKAAASLKSGTFFEYIPDDTSYVLASFEALPMGWFDAEAGIVELILAKATDEVKDPRSADDKLALALIKEFSGKLNPKGLAELGLKSDMQFAAYGLGPAPVIRIELSDQEKFLATFKRVETAAGASMEWKQKDGIKYIEEREGKGTVLFAVQKDHVVLAVYPTTMDAVMKPHVLGNAKPAKHIGEGRGLHNVAARHGFAGYAVGYVDFPLLIAGATGKSKGTSAAYWSAALGDGPEKMPAECADALIGLTRDKMPRFAFGYEELSKKRTAAAMVFELTDPHVKKLAALAATIPGVGMHASKEVVFAIGGGVNVLKAKELAATAAPVLKALADVCKEDDFRDAAESFTEPTPPQLQKTFGGVFAMTSMDFNVKTMDFKKLGAYAIGQGIDTEFLLGLIKSEAAEYMPKDFAADGKLRKIEFPMSGLIPDVFAGIRGEQVLVALGAGGKNALESALKTKTARAEFFYLRYDIAAAAKVLAQVPRDEFDADEKEVFDAISKYMESYKEASMALAATDGGLSVSFEVLRK